MKPTKIHYTYKITNLNPSDKRLYYIGVRSTLKASPELDTNYNSSSRYLKEALKEIGHKNFKKEIISTHKTRKLANQKEIRLHALYDVARNPLFYNKAKSTSTGFCTEGMVTVINLKTGVNEFVTIEESHDKLKYQSLYYDKVNATNRITGEKVTVTKNEYKNNPNLEHTVKGTVTVIDTETGIRRQVSQEEFRTNDKLVGQATGRVNVIDTRTGEGVSVTQEDFNMYEYYEHSTKGMITVIDISKNKMRMVNIDEYKNNENYKHRSSKVIHIFNPSGDIQYKSYGDFNKVCKENQLPLVALKESYQNNGKILYENSGSNKSRLQKAGYWRYRGWYAKDIPMDY